MKTGLIHIYTGDGKGKTTCSVGLGVRALSHNLKVCYSYFNKNPEKYGYTEIDSLEKLGARVISCTKGHPSFDKSLTIDDHKIQTQKSIEALDKIIHSEQFDLLIMDEIIISIRDGFIDESVIIEFIKNKPRSLELIMTGRGASKKLIELADYVSELKEVKHPMNQGIFSRKGIEF